MSRYIITIRADVQDGDANITIDDALDAYIDEAETAEEALRRFDWSRCIDGKDQEERQQAGDEVETAWTISAHELDEDGGPLNTDEPDATETRWERTIWTEYND